MHSTSFRLAAITVATILVTAIVFTEERASAQGPPDTIVSDWNQTLTTAAIGPVEGFAYAALMHLAIYDAVVTVEGGYKPFAYNGTRVPGASAEAAAATAGHAILTHYLPALSDAANTLYDEQLAAVPDGAAKTQGIAVGQAAAAAVIALPLGSEILARTDYVTPDPLEPGVWSPTAPGAPVAFWAQFATPLTLSSKNQLRPAGPPALDSAEWEEQFDEVKRLGAKNSTERTAEQTAAALFFAEPPFHQAEATFRYLMAEHELDLADSARFMAMVTTANIDGLLVCFEAKYHFQSWRPIHAIRGDDGNPNTEHDPDWEILLPGTPNHPEYPSAHSCGTPAWALLIEHFLGTSQINLTGVSVAPGGTNRLYPTTESLIEEVGVARIWGGIHFRQAVVDGTAMARQVAANIKANYFLPVQAEPTPTPPAPTATAAPPTATATAPAPTATRVAPMPPSTGTGPEPRGEGATPALGTGVVLVTVVLIALCGMAIRRRRTN